MLRRRYFLMAGGSTLALMVCPRLAIVAAAGATLRTDAEWRALLTPEQFAVLREAQTEQPYSSPLTVETRRGMYGCGGCGRDAFSSQTKYNSRTGWPSFWRPRPNTVREKRDRSEGLDRTKVECSNCGCHLGHVFGDGPPPTRLRYCLNGAGLKFTPA